MKITDFFKKKDIKTAVLQNGNKFIAPQIQYLNTTEATGQLEAYKTCAPVSAIINRLSRAACNANIVLSNDGKEKVIDLKPNPLQTFDQFFEHVMIYYYLFGEIFIYPVDRFAFILPNWKMKAYYLTGSAAAFSFENQISYWTLDTGIGLLRIQPDEVWHYKNSVVNDIEPLRGRSILYSLDTVVNNIMSAYEARRTLIERKGMIGILSGGNATGVNSMPLLQPEKDQLQQWFQSYGLSRNKDQVAITSAAVNWTPMTFPTRDLMLFEEIEDDLMKLCDAFGYPDKLLGVAKGTTFANVNEAKKSMYQDTIIPDTTRFLTWYSDKKKFTPYKLRGFFDHIEVLQESEQAKAQAFQTQSQGIINVLTSEISDNQKVYILTNFAGIDEAEAKKLVNERL